MLTTPGSLTIGTLARCEGLVLFALVRNPSAYLMSNLRRMEAIHAARPDFDADLIVPRCVD